MFIDRHDDISYLHLNKDEVESLTRLLQVNLQLLESEYFTRVGFTEKEAKDLVSNFSKIPQEEHLIIKIKLEQNHLHLLRQNFVEALYGIKVDDHCKTYGSSKEFFLEKFELLEEYLNES